MRHLKNAKLILARLGVAAILLALLPLQAYAGQITTRSLTISNSAISATGVSDTIAFTVPNVGSGNVGSINFQYCTTASGTCTAPTGLSTSSATLTAQTGASGFTINTATAGAPYITRTAAAITAGTALSYTLGGITNPSSLGTFYVRITTYTAAALGGTATDTGTVAASTANTITLNATVPETLAFCVYNTGGTCADSSTTTVNLGVLGATVTGTGTSQFAASTNAGTGYIITYTGTTLTSGANTIPVYTAAASPADGTSGFGMNLRSNSYSNGTSTVTIGADVVNGSAPSIGTYATGYGTANTFNFVASTPTTVAQSSGPTNNNTFTASYIANIGGAQAAGLYTTTLTYICTPTY
jgi:hypothetical protein